MNLTAMTCDHPLCFGPASEIVADGEMVVCSLCWYAGWSPQPAIRRGASLLRDRRIYARLRAMVAVTREDRRRFDRLAAAHIAGRGVPATPGAWLVAAEELTGVLA